MTLSPACTTVRALMARPPTDASVIGAATRLAGRVTGKGALRVEGNVRGEVSVSGPAEIVEQASVEGDVSAESLELAGTLVGDAKTRGPIAVRRSATVRGDLAGERISVEAGATVAARIAADFEIEAGGASRGRGRR